MANYYLKATGDFQTSGTWSATDGGAATVGWVDGKILTQNAASMAGKYYIFYVGQ